MPVRVHGLAPREGDAAFAFLVLRLATPVDRADLVDLLAHIAPLVPDAESFAAALPDDGEDALRLIGMPWSPPEAGHAFEVQRRLIEGAALHGIAEAWFFQTGTSLPAVGDDDDDAGDDEGDDGDDDGDDDAWSHGPPPQATQVRFPVDGYPEILAELDWEDFGIAFKLGGPWMAGERTVLIGFHAMWLAPYGGRYRNAAVTIDQRHHAAHLWVDRFAVSSSPREQVHHLLWVVSKLDEVMPVVHARFGGATMAQKYGGIMGDTSEPFVLGGNPLIAVHALAGEGGVDAWIATQAVWSSEEVAQMLRELAIDLATRRAPSGDGGAGEDGEDSGGELDVEAVFEAAGIGLAASGGDDDDDDDGGDDGGESGSTSDDALDLHDDKQRSRAVTYAGELLTERARAGLLDPRVAGLLRPVLGVASQDERRRTAAVSVLGAVRDRDSVPAMIRILDGTPIVRGHHAIEHQDLVIATVTALGEIADPAAIPDVARPAIAGAAHAVIDRAGGGGRDLRDRETRLLEAAVAALRDGPLDADTAALFDRMLRHANRHVKSALLQATPRDERLIGGMFHVLGERWDWQATAAKDWLSSYAGTAAYEVERMRARAPAGDTEAADHGDRDDDNVN